MEDIFKILADEGIEIPDEKKNGLRSKIAANYKTIKEFEDKIKSANDATETANKTIDDLRAELAKNTGDLANANKLIEAFEGKILEFDASVGSTKKEESNYEW